MSRAINRISPRFSEQEVAHYRDNGFVAIPGLFSGSELSALTGWVDELEKFPEEPGKTMSYYEDSVSEPSHRVLSRIEYFTGFHAGLGRFVEGPDMLARAADLFGEPAVLFKEKVNFKGPGGRGFEAHQDAQAGGGLGINGVYSRPPLGDHLEAGGGRPQHPLGEAVVAADDAVDIANQGQQVFFIHTFIDIGGDGLDVVFLEEIGEIIQHRQDIGRGDEYFPGH